MRMDMLSAEEETMADAPYEIASDVDWSYNSWFEDLNFDGVPDFVIGGNHSEIIRPGKVCEMR